MFSLGLLQKACKMITSDHSIFFFFAFSAPARDFVARLFVSLCMSIVWHLHNSVNSNAPCFFDKAALPSENEGNT